MSKNITFRLAAYTKAAGKFDPNAPNKGNEDNFYLDDDVSDENLSHYETDTVTNLSSLGMVMAVADGMGGMNAGEVASEIAIETVKDYFGVGRITSKIASNHESRKKYLEQIIIEADNRIKTQASQNSAQKGMGSTLIIAWIIGNEITLSWLGDSRCYRYNDVNGLELLSKDHSYVQELADKGVITYEQTFIHPQNNIVTRSLGDESKKAKPETRLFSLYKGDIILMCSDGLSGVLFDREFYLENNLLSTYNIEDIIKNNKSSLQECREALFDAAEKCDWYDNVTVILCEIIDGLPIAPKKEKPQPKNNEKDFESIKDNGKKSWKKSLIIILVCCIVCAIASICTIKYINKDKQSEKTTQTSTETKTPKVTPTEKIEEKGDSNIPNQEPAKAKKENKHKDKKTNNNATKKDNIATEDSDKKEKTTQQKEDGNKGGALTPAKGNKDKEQKPSGGQQND